MNGEGDKDHFQRALEAENQRAQEYLQTLDISDPKLKERASHILNTLYSKVLRSKIFPDNSYRLVVDRLASLTQNNGTIHVFGALAAPTAEKEAGAYISLHEAFTREGFNMNLGILFVNWQYLPVGNEYLGFEELTGQPVQSDAFHAQIYPARKILSEIPSIAINTWEFNLGRREKRTSMYADSIINAPEEIQRAAYLINPLSEGWTEEAQNSLEKLEQFYSKRRSLDQHGTIQPEFDWIMRRAVGMWVSAQAQKVPNSSFMTTTELNAKLLPFYGTPKGLPILNLKIPAI